MVGLLRGPGSSQKLTAGTRCHPSLRSWAARLRQPCRLSTVLLPRSLHTRKLLASRRVTVRLFTLLVQVSVLFVVVMRGVWIAAR